MSVYPTKSISHDQAFNVKSLIDFYFREKDCLTLSKGERIIVRNFWVAFIVIMYFFVYTCTRYVKKVRGCYQ